MARQIINTGATDNDPSAESVNSAFTKVNAMTLELFTANSLSGRQVIDLAGADTIRAAFQKWDTNSLALYTELGLAGRININDGAFLDDPSAESIRSAFQDINTMTAALYGAASGAVYVATTGSDTSGTGAIGTPYRTIAKGISVLTSGGTLYIRGGTYAERLTAGVIKGTAGNYTKVWGYPGETVTIRPNVTGDTAHAIHLSGTAGGTKNSYVHFKDLILDGNSVGGKGVVMEASSGGHFRFENLEVHHFPHSGFQTAPSDAGFSEWLNCHVHDLTNVTATNPHGIYMQTSNNLVDGGSYHDIKGWGIHCYTGFTEYSVDNNTIRNARFSVCGAGGEGGGITTWNGTNTLIYNNLVYQNIEHGISVNHATQVKIYNNTVYGTTTGTGIDLSSDSAPTATLRNNISYGNTANLSGTAGTSSNNVTANPNFVNAAAADFHLNSPSPAINTGFTLTGIVNTDIDGTARPQGAAYDVGAYERA